jgi:hypothetical protein
MEVFGRPFFRPHTSGTRQLTLYCLCFCLCLCLCLACAPSLCRQYSGTHRYTGAVLAYVFGVGSFMAVASPNFGGLFKKQQALEGAHRALQVGWPGRAAAWRCCLAPATGWHALGAADGCGCQHPLDCRRSRPFPCRADAAAQQRGERGLLPRCVQGGGAHPCQLQGHAAPPGPRAGQAVALRHGAGGRPDGRRVGLSGQGWGPLALPAPC